MTKADYIKSSENHTTLRLLIQLISYGKYVLNNTRFLSLELFSYPLSLEGIGYDVILSC